MNWRIKGTVQKALSAIPLGVQLNHMLQRTAGGLSRFQSEFDRKLDDALLLISYMRELNTSPAGQSMMEIGTGWFPVLPICFSLAGAKRIQTFDLVRHIKGSLTQRMLESFRPHLGRIARAVSRDEHAVEAEYEELVGARSIEELFARARIEYRAPADATKTSIADGSIDIVWSNSVLEHVPRDVIAAMSQEAARVLRPGGLLIHAINCADHYAYFDRNITFINYLTFDQTRWKFWNNELLYQNRMRPSDFIALSDAAGLEVVLKRDKPREDLIARLPGMKIAPEFQGYSPQDLCCTSFDYVARRP